MLRNLIYYVYPRKDNPEWRLNIEYLLRYWDTFMGQKIVTIARDETTVPTSRVTDLLPLGVDVWKVPNVPELGEAAAFLPALHLVASTNPDECTFYAHAKGVTYPPDHVRIPNVRAWRETMYDACLARPQAVEQVLQTHACCGCFRRNKPNYKWLPGCPWHFSGTYFWVKHDRLFTRPDWDSLEPAQGRHAVEAYLGMRFQLAESRQLVSHGRNLYNTTPERVQTMRYDALHWPERESTG
jgi:hypothetical protein